MVAIWIFCCDVKVDSINAMVRWKGLLETNDLQKHNNNMVIKAKIILLICLTAMFSCTVALKNNITLIYVLSSM